MKNNRPRHVSDSLESQNNYHNVIDRQEKIDSRCRHNSQYLRQFVEKYLNFARESISSGDRIAAEGFFQHADHYQRLLNEKIQERAAAEKAQRDLLVAEEKNESRDVHKINATESAASPDTCVKAEESTGEFMASAAVDDAATAQLNEQVN